MNNKLCEGHACKRTCRAPTLRGAKPERRPLRQAVALLGPAQASTAKRDACCCCACARCSGLACARFWPCEGPTFLARRPSRGKASAKPGIWSTCMNQAPLHPPTPGRLRLQVPRPAHTRTQAPAATRSGQGATVQRCSAQGRISQATPAAPNSAAWFHPGHSHPTAQPPATAQPGTHSKLKKVGRHTWATHNMHAWGEGGTTELLHRPRRRARPLGTQVRALSRPAAKPQHESNLLQH